MDLLDEEARKSLFSAERPVWTKVRDEMPTQFKPGACVHNSLIADGCVIEGTVENSVLFRGVRIGKNTVVRNAIIMQDARLLEGAYVENVILDKQVIISEKIRMQGAQSYPLVIPKNRTIR